MNKYVNNNFRHPLNPLDSSAMQLWRDTSRIQGFDPRQWFLSQCVAHWICNKRLNKNTVFNFVGATLLLPGY